jgi:hypothetical protein
MVEAERVDVSLKENDVKNRRSLPIANTRETRSAIDCNEFTDSNPLHPDHMTTDERLAEFGPILTRGLIWRRRLRRSQLARDHN